MTSFEHLKASPVEGVPGLYLVKDFISAEEEKSMLHDIDSDPEWETCRSGCRRVRFYVPWRDNKGRVEEKEEIRELPTFVKELATRVIAFGRSLPELSAVDWDSYKINDSKCTEMQINEFLPKDALGFHTDNVIAYKDVIVAVSLCSTVTITFRNPKTDQSVDVTVPNRSVYYMTGESRYKWLHGAHLGAVQSRRVSLTWRRVNYTPPVLILPSQKRKKVAAKKKDPSKYLPVVTTDGQS
eukprot:TRINITY_DN1179_c0_g1_i1.p1 TRINITY_DN1179_c0_g1~~TRINITY_DN1179_c0_g1_i1.p1  ORF type:complete len:240 (+),score=55.49 TRINITY_DN1179_c0_g1_i1:53-772(+)